MPPFRKYINEARYNPIIKSSFWTIFGYGLSQLIRLLGNIVLTKLLAPDMFGILAIVNVLIVGINMFSDIGLGPSIIQNKRGEEPDFINTVWTLQIIRGFLIWLVICLIALGLWHAKLYGFAELGKVYGHPDLPGLLVVVGFNAAISGFNSTSVYLVNRILALGRLTLINLFSQAIGICTIIVAAWYTHSIWALASGPIVTGVSDMFLSHLFLPGIKNKFCWDHSSVREIIKFGKWIFFSSIIGYIGSQGDRLVLGSYLTPEALGVYSIAFTLANLPLMTASMVCHKVMFPAFSRIHREHPELLKDNVIKAKKWFNALAMPATGFLIAFSQTIIDFLYDQRYSEAGWMMQWLLLRAATVTLLYPSSMVMTAIGLPVYATISSLLKTIFIFTALPLAHESIGAQGMIMAIAISGFIDAPILWFALIKHKLFNLKIEIYSVFFIILGYVFALLILDGDEVFDFIFNFMNSLVNTINKI